MADVAYEDISITKGDTEPFVFRFDEAGQSVDITGWTITFTVKEHDYDEVPKLSRQVKDHKFPEEGVTEIVLSPGETRIIGHRDHYDFQAETKDGSIYTFLRGEITAGQDVTLN